MQRTSLALVTFLSLVLPAPASAQDDAAILWKKTEARLDRVIAGARGIVGYAAIDLTTGNEVGTHQDMVFPQASAIKIPILMEVMREEHAGQLSLTERLRVNARAQVGGSGILQHFADGASELSLEDLCRLMILLSDNTATNMVINRITMDSVNAMLRRLGLKATALRRLMMDAEASAEDRENTSTPAEAAHIMALLHQGKFVNREVSERVLGLLSIGKGGSFARAFPDTVRVAWKPGGIAGVTTVWALVMLPERPFALALMEKFDSSGEAGAIEEEIARELFDYYWRIGNASRYGTFVDPSLRTRTD